MPTLKRPRAVMEAADKEFVADTLAQTKGLGDTIGTLPDARDTTEGIKQGMTLIDRFYNGGNQARPGVADILVTVLDQVIGRMRQRNANAQATIDRCNEECATLDKAIGLAHTYVPGPPCGTGSTVRTSGAGQLAPGRHALHTRRTSCGPGHPNPDPKPNRDRDRDRNRPSPGSRSSSRHCAPSTR